MAYDGSIVIDTQLDTSSITSSLKSLISSLTSSLSGLGGTIGKTISTPFEVATASVKTSLNQIENSFSSLEGTTSALGKVITNNTSVPFQTASKSIVTNSSSITKQITNISKSLSSIESIIGNSISDPFKTASKSVTSNLKTLDTSINNNVSGPLQEASNNVGDLANEINNISTVSSAFSSLIQMVSKTVIGFQTAKVQLKLFTIENNAAALSQAALNGTLTLGETIVAAMTGQVGISTAAQTLWNAALNAFPIIAIVAGIAAIIAGIALLVSWLNKETEEEKKAREEAERFTQTTNKLCEANKNLNSSIADGQKQRANNLGQVEAETKANQKLTDQLYELSAKENKTNEEKEKMQALVDELNRSMPDLQLEFDKETGALSKNKDEVYKAIQAKRELARQNAATNMLTEAYQDQFEAQAAMNTLLDQEKDLKEKIQGLENKKSLSKAESEALKSYKDSLSNVQTQIQETSATFTKATNEINTANGILDSSTQSASASVALSADGIKKAFTDAAGSTTGSTDDMKTKLTEFGNSMIKDYDAYGAEFITAWQSSIDDASPEALGSIDSFMDHVLSKMDEKDKAELLGRSNSEHFAEGSKAGIKTEEIGIVEKTESESEEAQDAAHDGGAETTEAYVDAANEEAEGKTVDYNTVVENSSEESVEISKESGKNAGREYAQGIIEGVQEKTAEVTEAIKTMAQTVERDSNEAVKTIAKPLGGALINGIELGATDQQGPLNESIQKIVRDAIDAGKREADVNSPSKETRDEIGKPLVEGLVKGIDSEQNGLNKSMGGLLNNMLKFGKKVMGIHSPSTVMRDEIGEQIDRGIAQGIKENSDVVLDEFNKLLDALDDKRELNLISEDEYYEQLEALTREYLDENSEEWRDHMIKVYKYQQECYEASVEAAEEAYTKIAETVKEKLDEIEKAQSDFKKKMTGGSMLGALYNEVDGESELTANYLFDGNYRAEQVDAYAEQIKQIQELAGDKSLYISQILREMDFATGQQFLNTLLHMDPSKRDAFLQGLNEDFVEKFNGMESNEKLTFAELMFSTMDTGSKKAAEIISETMQGAVKEADSWDNVLDLLWKDDKKQVEDEARQSFAEYFNGAQLPEDFWQFGEDSAANFARAFVEQATSDETQANIQSAGEAAGDALAKGINTSLAGNTIKTELEKTFGALPDDFFELGKEASEKFCNGFAANLLNAFATARRAFLDVVNSFTPALGVAGGGMVSSASNTYNNSYNFYGSGQTVSQQLRQARADASLQKLRNI